MRIRTYVLLAVFSGMALTSYAQQRGEGEAGGKPIPLFFRETFKAPPVASEDVVFGPEHVSSPNLEIKLYGPGTKPMPGIESGLWLVNRGDGLPGSPVVSYVWSGMTQGNWAVT